MIPLVRKSISNMRTLGSLDNASRWTSLLMRSMQMLFNLSMNWFGRSEAMALGGGLSMFFLVAMMLGLFGSPVIPSVVRINALNYFNYVSIIPLFDVISVLDGTMDWIWKLAILLVIGLLVYILGSAKFKKKDLPL